MPQIVTINESVIRGAEPSLLQKKGCLISLGATSLSAGETRFVADLSELTALIDPSSTAQVQSFSNGQSSLFIRGESNKNFSNQIIDPPVVGNNPSYEVPFTINDCIFKNKYSITKGVDTQFDIIASSSKQLPATFMPSSLTFSKFRKGDSDFVTNKVTYKEKDDKGNIILTVFLDSSVDDDIPANTEFKLDISGFSVIDNTQSVSELMAMGTSWFSNNNNGCYILELGILQPNMMGASFSEWYEQNTSLYYGYVFPRKSALDSTLASFLSDQSGNNTRVYFFFCGDKDGYSHLIANSVGQKSTFYGVEYTGSVVLPTTTSASQSAEHLAAAVCAQYCSASPSALNRLAPMSFRVLNGITPWPEARNKSYFQKFKTDNVGFAGTANEGGVQDSILFWGNFMNGDSMSGWYGADWCSINMELQLANTIIEGSQPGISPLVYNQSGISRLAACAQQTLNSAVSCGCILSDYSLNVTSFENYLRDNPSDYTAGIYNGLASTVVPVRGFLSLTYNLAVDFSGQTVTATTTH